jgi:hypothetical protein
MIGRGLELAEFTAPHFRAPEILAVDGPDARINHGGKID